MTGRHAAIVVALVLMATALLYAVVIFAARPRSSVPWLEPAKSGTTCVLPRETMRYAHMTYLEMLRDRVVRQGDRTRSLHAQGIASCRGCHEHRETFCDKCHEAASVRLGCFKCHAY
jgi:hypothetical protein